jgi:hypothetical protein
MPAPLSLRIKERYMAKRADGLSQQVAADAAGISVRSAQRIDRGELQPEGQQQQRGRHWRTRADPLAEVWESVLVPMLEKAPQLEPQTLLLHLEQLRPGEEWFRRKRTLQRRVEQWRALHGPAQEVMFLQEHRGSAWRRGSRSPGLSSHLASQSLGNRHPHNPRSLRRAGDQRLG